MRAASTPRPDPGPLRPFINSFEIALRADHKADKTILIYTDAVSRLAGFLLERGVRDWAKVTRDHVRAYQVALYEHGYSQGYVNQQHRSLQQFFKWYGLEEETTSPMTGLKPPPLAPKMVPVLSPADLGKLIKDAESKRDFAHRRDAAILRLFASAGVRLSELANLQVTDVDLRDRTAFVTGKAGKQRKVAFDARATQALDRYLRMRAAHPAASLPALWLGSRREVAMTPSGVYQMIARRGERNGIQVHPHMFRHTFAHAWLDAGGAEGDLMELAGWTSAAMLRHYGASARAARARRAYDRVDVMRGV